jgi:putative membrane protein
MNTTIKTPVKLGLAMLAAGLLLAVPCAQAQSGLTKADVKFLGEAAQGGMTEVKLGELVAEKGTTDEVKEFGKLMVKDHGIMNENLKTLAAQKGVVLPAELDEKHQALVDKMKGLPGSELDDTYVIEMVKAHQADAKAFKDELATTQDADIQGFLTKSIPVVEAHLRHVGGMQKAAASPTTDIKN